MKFAFLTQMLAESAPKVKWESARAIGNIAHLYPLKLKKAISNLLINSEYDGIVVRWASALALGEILKLKTNHNKTLIPTLESIYEKEKDSDVKKKYLDAIKKVKK